MRRLKLRCRHVVAPLSNAELVSKMELMSNRRKMGREGDGAQRVHFKDRSTAVPILTGS